MIVKKEKFGNFVCVRGRGRENPKVFIRKLLDLSAKLEIRNKKICYITLLITVGKICKIAFPV